MLREFLYVDVARVRSLLAQLDAGVVEEVVSSTTEAKSRGISARVHALNAAMSFERGDSEQESRSLQDLTFTIFEEVAQADGVLRDADADMLGDADAWSSGAVQDALVEGEIIRLSGTVQVLDATLFLNRLARFEEMVLAINVMQKAQFDAAANELRGQGEAVVEAAGEQAAQQARSAGLPHDQINRARNEGKRIARRDVDATIDAARPAVISGLENFAHVRDIARPFIGADAVNVRVMPEGIGDSSCGFSGSLLSRDDYLQREREALFSRYGSVLHGWTAVLQIATIPIRRDGSAQAMNLDDLTLVTDGGVVSRSTFEAMMLRLGGFMEAQGIMEGPTWPTISVVPLAIYRVVPRSGVESTGSDASQT